MVTGRLTRVVALLAIVGVIGFDGMSVVTAHFKTSDDAETAAQAAADGYRQQGSVNAAVAAAEQALPAGDTLVNRSVLIEPGGAVSLRVRRTAKSLVLHMFSQTRAWAVVTQTGSANPPS